ncbi:VasL domain-containing protein [Buttiauxella gaviniae]|uniref:VasL domain-containing protein n=1 Tax=Buttiauxella gaviniae TaxID=82990 RepID=UPI003975D3B2
MNQKSQTLSEVRFNPVVPKHSKVFLLLSSEMSKLNATPNAALNWMELDKFCQRIFQQHGYDLHSGAWFCLVQLRLNGWAGAAKSLELLASALSFGERHGSEVADLGLRRYALEWFTAHVITPMYTQAQSMDDAKSLTRTGAALDIITRQAQKLQIRGADMLNNLGYFLQVRARTSQNVVLDVDPAQQIQLVCKTPPVTAPVEAVALVPVPEETVALEVSAPLDSRWRWLAVGALAATLLISLPAWGLWFFQRLAAEPVSLAPFSALHETARLFEAAQLSQAPLNAKELHEIDSQLQLLSQQPSLWLLQQGNKLAVRLAESAPGNPASASWEKMLQQNTLSPSRAEGWFEVQRRLDQLEQRLLASEKKQRSHITISELKTEIYEMKQALKNMPIPVSVLLLQRQQASSQDIEKEKMDEIIEAQLDNLSREYILMAGK